MRISDKQQNALDFLYLNPGSTIDQVGTVAQIEASSTFYRGGQRVTVDGRKEFAVRLIRRGWIIAGGSISSPTTPLFLSAAGTQTTTFYRETGRHELHEEGQRSQAT